MDVNQITSDGGHTDGRTHDPQPSEHVVTLTGTISFVICLYLAIWVPLGVAFDGGNTAAILCPSLAALFFEMVNIFIVYEFYYEEDLYEKNLNMKYFMRWSIASCVGCLPPAVIIFIWTSSFSFLVIMAIIGVVLAALKNISVCLYMAILLCIRR